jgi:hypothetical protein
VRRSWLAVLLLPLAACTGPVRSANVDESKAGVTAEAVASAVETARLAVQAAQDGRAYGRYLTQVLADAEEDADAAQGAFEGIRPPDGRADELRDRLDEPLGEATDTLAELRTLARRGRFAELAEPAAPLARLAEELHAFAEAHA